jgi:hypothetical protein
MSSEPKANRPIPGIPIALTFILHSTVILNEGPIRRASFGILSAILDSQVHIIRPNPIGRTRKPMRVTIERVTPAGLVLTTMTDSGLPFPSFPLECDELSLTEVATDYSRRAPALLDGVFDDAGEGGEVVELLRLSVELRQRYLSKRRWIVLVSHAEKDRSPANDPNGVRFFILPPLFIIPVLD